MQSFAFIGADGERTVPGFTAGFRVLKLRANLVARRDSRPPVSRGSVNLKGGPKGPGESYDDGLHLNGAIVAAAGMQSSPPFTRYSRRFPALLASAKALESLLKKNYGYA
jgi:hypothetical protein